MPDPIKVRAARGDLLPLPPASDDEDAHGIITGVSIVLLALCFAYIVYRMFDPEPTYQLPVEIGERYDQDLGALVGMALCGIAGLMMGFWLGWWAS